MKNPFKVSLKANEKIYVNGAVLRFDRRTSIEFLNDVSFLLEAHVMQLEDAVSPVQQLYYIIQILLMAPDDALLTKAAYRQHLGLLAATQPDGDVARQIETIDQMVASGRYYEAMKFIRSVDASVVLRRDERERQTLHASKVATTKAA
jgi:flagellar biosynthesis repressor protein FlbT